MRLYGAKSLLAYSLCAVALTGCTFSGNEKLAAIDNGALVTGSVAGSASPNGIAQTDAEIIKSTVAHANTQQNSLAAKPLAWVNPDTGSSGAIDAIEMFMGKHGQQCRGFRTSVESFKGVALYNGETCQLSATQWVLSWFRPIDYTGK